jgi:hypothetical protein
MGQSDLAKSETLMDQLDRTYTNWMRDLDKSKGRILVPDWMLEVNGPGGGVSFDVDREVFQTLGSSPSGENALSANLQIVQFDFDPAKYLGTAQQIVEDVLRRAGYSAQTFGEDESGGAATATEITSRDRRSATTRDRKLRHWAPAVRQIVQKLLIVDNLAFGQGGLDPESVLVKFAEASQETPLQLATTANMLAQAAAASTRTQVALVNSDWEADEIDKEVARIYAENGLGQVANPDEAVGEPAPFPTEEQQ